MDGERMDELEFWVLVAIGDRERNRDQIHNRLADLFRASGVARRPPGSLEQPLKDLCRGDLVERFGGGLLRRDVYRLTEVGRQACMDEVGLRRRELDAIDKDLRRWSARSASR